MLTDAERAEMTAEVPVILARYSIRPGEIQALTSDLSRWIDACVIGTSIREYTRGQRSVLAPR